MKFKWQFLNLFFLVVLVALVLIPPSNRNLLGQQWRGVFQDLHLPLSISKSSSPLLQIEYLRRNLTATGNQAIDEKKETELMQSVVNRHPNDAALLAYYLRKEKKLYRGLNEKGPLASNNLAWSVIVNEGSDNFSPAQLHPSNNPNFGKIRHNGPFSTKKEYEDTLALIRRGQKLEPQNTYIDWMLMYVLLLGDREKQAIDVLENAWQKTDFDDHTSDESMAMTEPYKSSGLETNIKYSVFNATKNPNLSDRIKAQILSPRAVIDVVNKDVDEAKTLFKEPYNGAKVKAVEQEFSESKEVRLKPIFYGIKFSETRRNVALKLLLLRLALQAYYAENGEYPQKLNDLTPKYLKSIPKDDFGRNQPFGYRLAGKKYVLWSIGPDGKDDKGSPILSTKPKRMANELVYADRDSLGDWVAGVNR
jgi:hypothetical protein